MTPEERDLIAGLFERMRATDVADKDREAEAYIAQLVRQTPDAAYKLVQSVLVQEHALQEAGARIEELEDRLSELERDQRPTKGGGSFLGGLLGGGRGEERPAGERGSSVPTIGSRSTPSVYDSSRTSERSAPPPWAQASAEPQQRGGGGSFLGGAMATAAGVVGGMLLADSIRGLMGGKGGEAHATSSNSKSGAGQSSSPEAKHDDQPHYQDASDNDPGTYDVDAGDSSWGIDDIDV